MSEFKKPSNFFAKPLPQDPNAGKERDCLTQAGGRNEAPRIQALVSLTSCILVFCLAGLDPLLVPRQGTMGNW